MVIKKMYECRGCGWNGRLEFNTYRASEEEKHCKKCNGVNLEEIEEMGKFGSEKHIELIKKALLVIIDRYYVRHAKIVVENHKMSLSIGSRGMDSFGVYANKDFYPDICVSVEDISNFYLTIEGKKYKKIFVECETTQNNLLKDENRMVAYKLLKLQNPDLAIYLAVPSALKGKITKPDFCNDVWYFDIKESEDNLKVNVGEEK